MKNNKLVVLILVAAMALALLTGCGNSAAESSGAAQGNGEASSEAVDAAAAAPVSIQLAHCDAESENSIHHKMALLFQQYVSELSGGSMEIEIVGGGQLGGERDLVEGMQLGTIEMASTANMVLSNFMPEFSVLDLPYMYSNYETAYKVLDSEVIAGLMEKFAKEQGVHILAYAQGGFRQFVCNKSIDSVEDVAGVKTRVPESDIYIDTFNAMGASPVPMAWGDTFTALQQGTVDAFEITPAVVLSNGFYEVCSDIAITNHLFSPNPLMISEALFQSLSEEQRAVLSEAAQKAAVDQRAWIEESVEGVLADLEEKGMTVDRPDIDSFQKKVQDSGVYEKYSDKIGAELIDAVQSIVNG